MSVQTSPAKRTLNISLALFVGLIMWIFLFHNDWVVAGIPKAHAQAATISDSDLSNCQGEIKAPACSKSCPSTSYEIGRDQNGAPICHAQPTGCPYGDAIPLDSPKCQPPVAHTSDVPAAPEITQLQGK